MNLPRLVIVKTILRLQEPILVVFHPFMILPNQEVAVCFPKDQIRMLLFLIQPNLPYHVEIARKFLLKDLLNWDLRYLKLFSKFREINFTKKM